MLIFYAMQMFNFKLIVIQSLVLFPEVSYCLCNVDPHLHGTFRQYGGLEIILSTLHQVKSIAFATGTQVCIYV